MIGSKIAKGAAWMVLLRGADRSLGLVNTFILARLLLPSDFGIVAMAMSVIALLQLMTAFGLDLALIQHEEPSSDHYDTAWTLNVVFMSGCAVFIALAAYPTAVFYDESRLLPVMLALSVGWAMQAFENVGTVEFRRSFEFHKETYFRLGKRFAGFLVCLTLALQVRSYWALVAGMLTTQLAGLLLSYMMHPYRPRFSLRARQDLLSFSQWLFLNSLLNFGARRLSHFIVGKLYGSSALGAYTLGAEIAFMPHTELIAPINRAVFPGYARMAKSVDELRSSFVQINSLIATLALPAGTGLALVAEPLILVLLGENWRSAADILQVLALGGAGAALISNSYSAYLALGRPYVDTWLLFLEISVLVVGLFIFPRMFGVVGIAYAELLAVLLSTVAAFPALFVALKIRLGSFLLYLWRPTAATIGMCLSVYAVRVRFEMSSIVELATLMTVGAVTYAGALMLFWQLSGRPNGAEQTVVDFLGSRIRRSPAVQG